MKQVKTKRNLPQEFIKNWRLLTGACMCMWSILKAIHTQLIQSEIRVVNMFFDVRLIIHYRGDILSFIS